MSDALHELAIERNELKVELAAERAKVAAWENAAQCGHPNPCTLGPLCPYCEIERQKDRATDAESQAALLRAALEEAPHAEGCASHGLRYAQQIEQYCDCFKSVLRGETK